MKNYLLKTKENSRRSKDKRVIRKVLFTIVSFFIVLFLFKPILSFVGGALSSPVYFVSDYIQSSSAIIPTYLRERSEINHEIARLKDEISLQDGSLLALRYVEEENKELRALMGASSIETIGAGILANPPLTPYDTVVIDRGSAAGVVVGAPVYYGSGLALGYVRSVSKHSALVTLFTSSEVETTVYIFGPDIFTVAYGEGGGVLRISVPQGIDVAEGNLVALPSLEGGVLGEINIVQSLPTEPEQHAYVTLETPLRSVRLVRVGTRSVNSASFMEALENVSEMKNQLFTFDIPEDFQISTTTGSATNTPE